jgi:hypothetical protein
MLGDEGYYYGNEFLKSFIRKWDLNSV